MDIPKGDEKEYDETMTGPPISKKRPNDLTTETTPSHQVKKKSGSDKENQTTKTSESSQVTDITDMSATTFNERLEANNKQVRNGITPSIKSEIKHANMEVLKKVEETFTIFKNSC